LKPLARYFPELAASLVRVLPGPVLLDGEIVIVTGGGLAFGALLMRIHPAASRVQKLAAESPASFVAFDLLAERSEDLRAAPFSERRARLDATLTGIQPPAYITPMTPDFHLASQWFDEFEGAGLDGVIAKRADEPYRPGARSMLKIKHLRTVDCVVGGLRWYKGMADTAVGSLLLGLYDTGGVLHHVGHTSSFKADEKRALAQELRPMITDDEDDGFGGGRTPGGQSRWTGRKDVSWVRLRPELVCEVSFDHLQGDRFRHAATFRRWRPDKPPASCTYDQLDAPVPYALKEIFGLARGGGER
jgi:ATP-dependent DNA ligase